MNRQLKQMPLWAMTKAIVILDLIQYPESRLQENAALLFAVLSPLDPPSGLWVKPTMTELLQRSNSDLVFEWRKMNLKTERDGMKK